jgi:hypothetical protein
MTLEIPNETIIAALNAALTKTDYHGGESPITTVVKRALADQGAAMTREIAAALSDVIQGEAFRAKLRAELPDILRDEVKRKIGAAVSALPRKDLMPLFEVLK